MVSGRCTAAPTAGWGWAFKCSPGSLASYLLQLVLGGETSGHCLDEVGEGEGATSVTAGQGDIGTVSRAEWLVLSGWQMTLYPHSCPVIVPNL